MYLNRIGTIDIKGLLKSIGWEGLQNYLIKSAEEGTWQIKNNFPLERRPDPNILFQATWIVDMAKTLDLTFLFKTRNFLIRNSVMLKILLLKCLIFIFREEFR